MQVKHTSGGERVDQLNYKYRYFEEKSCQYIRFKKEIFHFFLAISSYLYSMHISLIEALGMVKDNKIINEHSSALRRQKFSSKGKRTEWIRQEKEQQQFY